MRYFSLQLEKQNNMNTCTCAVYDVAILNMAFLDTILFKIFRQLFYISFFSHSQTLPLEVSVLQVFYVYAQQCPGSQLGECWFPLLSMVKEGTLTLSPPAQLVLLAILNEFVQRAPPLQEKKDVKELQVRIWSSL